MKITKSKLKHIIKEELKRVLLEQESFWFGDDEPEENVPTESDLNYLSSLGMDDELSTPGRRTLARPEEVLNLRQAGVDPTGLDLGYDPDYIPHSNLGHYRPRDIEEYVPSHSIPSQQFPELETRMGAQKWNEREAERARVRGYDPSVSPESLDQFLDLFPLAGERHEDLPETGGVFVKQNRLRQYGTPHMQDYIQSLGNVSGGGWYVGDISQEGGGKLRYTRRSPSGHDSHQTGTDVDLSIPTITGAGMSTRPWKRSRGKAGRHQIPEEWSFRNIRANEMDYDKTVEFLRHTAPRAEFVFLDSIFFPGIRTRVRELVQSGDMSSAEARNIRRVLRRKDTAHKNHFHVRLRGVYPHERAGRGRGRQPERYASGHGQSGEVNH